MTQAITQRSFFDVAIAEFASFPRRGLAYLGIAGAAVSVSNWIWWWSEPDAPLFRYAVSAVSFLGWGVAIYAVSMMMMAKRPSGIGFLRFAITSVAMVTPIIVSALLVLFSAAHESGWGMMFSGALCIVSVVVVALLPGWPVMQAVSTKLIGPRAAFGATRGFRWHLFIAAFAASGINGAVPEVGENASTWWAAAVAALGGGIAIMSGMIALCIGTASAKLMLAEISEPGSDC